MEVFRSPKGPFVQINKDSPQVRRGLSFSLEKGDYSTLREYDSAQKSLPKNKRDGWLRRKVEMKTIELNIRYQHEHGGLIRELINDNVHNWPKVLFVSLPLFALLLKLLYIRRKQFYYVDHGIFTIHLYIFSFLILLAFFFFSELKDKTGWGWVDWLILVTVLYPFIYYYKAMRRFYGQRRTKTILKYVLLFILSFFVYLTIFVGGILFTVFEA
jgi:hypothetical protein